MYASGDVMDRGEDDSDLLRSIEKKSVGTQCHFLQSPKKKEISKKKQQILRKIVTHHIDLVPFHNIDDICYDIENTFYYKIMSKPYLKLDNLIYKLFSNMYFAYRDDQCDTILSEKDCLHHQDPNEKISIYKHLYVNKLRLAKPSDSVQMVFNVGPNYLQLLYWDKISKCTQAYMLDENTKTILRVKQTFKKIFMSDLGADYFLTQINVFKCKCICKNCLVNSYSYNLGYCSNHTKQTFSVINHIFHRCHGNIDYNEWTLSTLKMLLLQLNSRNQYLFGSSEDVTIHIHHSIKHLSPFYCLFKTAGCDTKRAILENQYSYLGFLYNLFVLYIKNICKIGQIKIKKEFRFEWESSDSFSNLNQNGPNFINDVDSVLPTHQFESNSNGSTSIQASLFYDLCEQKNIENEIIQFNYKTIARPVTPISTGKEKKEKIDGVSFISFKTESDMLEYTNLENDANSLNNGQNLSNHQRTPGKIIPTKTNDITKIKGWRKKVFSTSLNVGNTDSSKTISMSNVPLPIKDIKQEPSDDTEIEHCELLESQPCEELTNTPSESPESSTKFLYLNSDLTNCLHDVYVQTLAEDELLKQLEVKAKEDCENSNVFESDYLNDYLTSHSKLNVSFKIPSLLASEKFETNPFKPDSDEENLHQELDDLINRIKDFRQSSNDNDENENPEVLRYYKDTLNNGFQDHSDSSKLLKIKNSRGRKSSNPDCKPVWESEPIKRKADLEEDQDAIRIKRFKIPFPLKTRIEPFQLKTKVEYHDKQYLKSPFLQSTNHTNVPSTNCSYNTHVVPEEIVKTKVSTATKPKHFSLLKNYIDEDVFFKKIEYPSVNENAMDSLMLSRVSNLKCPLVCQCKYVHNRKKYEHLPCSQLQQFNLGMMVHIGNKRPIKNGAVENLSLLKKDDTIVDSRSAWMAASAVINHWQKRKVSRFIVPVVSNTIVSSVLKSVDGETLLKNVPLANQSNEEPDDEVKQVLDDIVDFTVRALEMPSLDFDPDIPPFEGDKTNVQKKDHKDKASKVVRELKKLINVSIVDVYQGTEPESENDEKEQCSNDFCIKGCVCDSINGKGPFSNHCGKINCMFKCSCTDKGIFLYGNNKQSPDYGLAKEEMTWHQTVIRKSNSDIEVMTGTEKAKRETKLPKRFRDVLLGKEMSCIDARASHPTHFTPPQVSPELTSMEIPEEDNYQDMMDDECDFGNCTLESYLKQESERRTGIKSEKNSKSPPKMILNNNINQKKRNLWNRGVPVKLQILTRRFKFCSQELKGGQTLADVFIWCAIHSKFNCLCVNWVTMLKRNMVLWKPDRSSRYLANKVMFDIPLDQPSCFTLECQVYNTHLFCARTFGSLFDYRPRNRHPLFKEKRSIELKNNLTSYSNSYVRLKLFVANTKQWSADAVPTDPSDVVQTKEIQNINFRSRKNKGINLDEDALVDIEYISGDEASICYDDDIEECTSFEDSFNETLPIDSLDCSTDIPENNSTHVPENNSTHIEKPTLPQGLLEDLKMNGITLTKCPKAHSKSMSQKTTDKPLPSLTSIKLKNLIPKITLIEGNPNSSRHFPSTTTTESVSGKDFSANLMEEDENPGFKLSEALKKNSQDEDGLPKHGLLCLTPGIGYLRVIEFTPTKISVQDPQSPDVYHTFGNLEATNQWLNRFFKNRLLFDSIDTELKWIIVKPGILKLKQSIPFPSVILEDPSVMITKNGLIHKKRGQDSASGGKQPKSPNSNGSSNYESPSCSAVTPAAAVNKDTQMTTEMIKRKLAEVSPSEDNPHFSDIKKRKSNSLSEKQKLLSDKLVRKPTARKSISLPTLHKQKASSSNVESLLLSSSSSKRIKFSGKSPTITTISPIVSTSSSTSGKVFPKIPLPPLPKTSTETSSELQFKQVQPIMCSSNPKVRTVIVPRYMNENESVRGIPIHSFLRNDEDVTSSSQPIAAVVQRDGTGTHGIIKDNVFYPINIKKLPPPSALVKSK